MLSKSTAGAFGSLCKSRRVMETMGEAKSFFFAHHGKLRACPALSTAAEPTVRYPIHN